MKIVAGLGLVGLLISPAQAQIILPYTLPPVHRVAYEIYLENEEKRRHAARQDVEMFFKCELYIVGMHKPEDFVLTENGCYRKPTGGR